MRLGRPDRHDGNGHRQRDERDQDDRVVNRALRREHERQQQDRPELADRARREQVGAELRVQLAGVRKDRQQRPDRGGRKRRADIYERDDNSRRGERATEPVGDRERHRPPEQRKPQRTAANARDVDLVAGEEEQHAQTEIGEELREVIDLRDVESLGPDHHAQHQLEHDHRQEQTAPARDGGDRPGHRPGHDDREERSRVDREHFRCDVGQQHRHI